jgi:hypothetical protein
MKRACVVMLLVMIGLGASGVARAGSAYAVGDVFVAITGVGVNEYTSSGALVQTINSGLSSAGYLTGMAFDSTGSLLVTDFSATTVWKFDNSGTLVNNAFLTGLSAPESLAIDSTGNIYSSNVGGGIKKFASTGGAAIGTSLAGTRTDWIDLAADQHTMLYTNESHTIGSVNVATNTTNPNFTTLGGQYALRIIPSGADAGDVLVANSSEALLLNSTGTSILHTYTWAGNNGSDFALNIDPNGKDFWTGDIAGHVAEFNILTGTLDQSWSSAAGGGVYGLVVFGQQTASGGGGGTGGGGNKVPEPGSLSLLACGFVALGSLTKLRRLVNV